MRHSHGKIYTGKGKGGHLSSGPLHHLRHSHGKIYTGKGKGGHLSRGGQHSCAPEVDDSVAAAGDKVERLVRTGRERAAGVHLSRGDVSGLHREGK